MHENIPVKRIVTVAKIPDLYPDAFTLPAIRWLIFNEHENGLHVCLRRIGKKILIDLDLFEKWVDEQAAKPVQRPARKKKFSQAE